MRVEDPDLSPEGDGSGIKGEAKAATRVTSIVDGNDLGHSGVRLERKTGAPLVLAEGHDPMPEMDPTCDRANVAIDAAWASALGRDIARWLGVPHIDQILVDPGARVHHGPSSSSANRSASRISLFRSGSRLPINFPIRSRGTDWT